MKAAIQTIPSVLNEKPEAAAFDPVIYQATHQCPPLVFKNGIHAARVNERAFARMDLVAVIAVIGVLAGWFGFCRFGERGRIARCTQNLKVLSEAMQKFADDHAGTLPLAGSSRPVSAWNMELAPYLQRDFANATSPGAVKQLTISQKAVASIFACPSDPFKRDQPRSYAMSAHDMQPENWPPGPENETGVGLMWNDERITRLLGREFDSMSPKEKHAAFAKVKLSWIPDPANTLLLTELFHADNQLGRWGQVVTRAQTQVAAIGADAARCHAGRFNYLMLDGHVELLSPLETGSWRGDRGIWTLRKGD